MIKTSDFLAEFQKHDKLLLDAGYKRQADGKYISPNNTVLQAILNRWGWTENEGWDFFIRLTDTQTVAGSISQPTRDIRPQKLSELGLIEHEELEKLYKSISKDHTSVFESYQSGSFGFYDIQGLETILDLLSPAFAQAAMQWDRWRIEQRQLPAPKPRSKEETERLREEALAQLKDAGFKLEKP